MDYYDRPQGMLRRFTNVVVLIITILICTGFIISAYSGHVSPLDFKYAQLAMYTFPGWLAGVLLIFIIDLIWWRRTAMIAGLSLLICVPQVHSFCPLNIPRGKMNEEEKARSFTLMTYNVMQFANQNKDAELYANPQIEYILKESPDIVCIEESHCLSPDPRVNHITQEQLAEINKMYPYVYVEGEYLALFSKYETKAVPIGFPQNSFQSGDIAGWRLFINDQVINLFIVHLRSFALSFDERYLFRDITNLEGVNRQEISEAKSDLIPKIYTSSVDRVKQYEWLVKCLKKFGGENTIVCGDFNDPVGSYGLYLLEKESNMKQVYPEVGFGPMITYNANNFFFRIDHILYRGNLTPYSIKRGNLKASDHYPLTATFLQKPPLSEK